jgi:hypothetical protein
MFTSDRDAFDLDGPRLGRGEEDDPDRLTGRDEFQQFAIVQIGTNDGLRFVRFQQKGDECRSVAID